MLEPHGATVSPAADGAPFAVRAAVAGNLTLAVCDGADSWGAGIEASRLGAQVIAESLSRTSEPGFERFKRAFADAGRAAFEKYDGEPFSALIRGRRGLRDAGCCIHRVGWKLLCLPRTP